MPINDNLDKRIDEWYKEFEQIMDERLRPVYWNINNLRWENPDYRFMDYLVLEQPVDENTRTEEFIEKLQANYPSLHLAGSRAFAKRDMEGGGQFNIVVDANTDYDLFMEYSINGSTWLSSEGFEPIDMEEYGGPDTKELWTHQDYPLLQITTRTRADAYKWVVENMPLDVYRDVGWKSGPKKPSREAIRRLFNAWTDHAVRVMNVR